MTERSFADLNLIGKNVRTLLVAFAVTVSVLASAQAADPAAGKTLALQWCSACHLVAEEQKFASSVSLPSFYDIARDTSWTSEKLATFLTDPHPKMPNMTLGNIEIVNLADYIKSLNK